MSKKLDPTIDMSKVYAIKRQTSNIDAMRRAKSNSIFRINRTIEQITRKKNFPLAYAFATEIESAFDAMKNDHSELSACVELLVETLKEAAHTYNSFDLVTHYKRAYETIDKHWQDIKCALDMLKEAHDKFFANVPNS